MKFRAKEIRRWERWKETSQLPIFLLSFLLYFGAGLLFRLFESTRFLGLGWGFSMGMVMGVLLCVVDRYRQVEYEKSKGGSSGLVQSGSREFETHLND